MLNKTVESTGPAAPPTPKKPALGRVIHETLENLVERSNSVTLQLEEFERYLFGMRETAKGSGNEEEVESDCWETNIMNLLDRAHVIITEQEQSLRIISNFNN